MPEIPKPTKYREEVSTITPKSDGSWPGSRKANETQAGEKSKGSK